jgi:hypothetical protein
MEKSETLAELFSALSKAQGQIEAASKGSVNPHFKSRYADLNSLREVIREPLLANDLAVIQAPSIEGNCVAVTTFLTHKSGEFISSTLRMPFGQNTAQAIGSAITYCRRYSLSSILNLAAEDDDGNAATESVKATPALDVTKYLSAGDKIASEGSEALANWWKGLSKEVRDNIPNTKIAEWKKISSKTETVQ